MKIKEKIEWYQCRRDISITASLLLIFGIAILHFEIFEYVRKDVWIALKVRTGMRSNLFENILFDLGFWLPTLAVLIESTVVCLKHYWSWIIITLLGIAFFLTLEYLHNLENAKQFIDILRSEFSDIPSIIYFLKDFSTYVLFSIPYGAIVSIVVFTIRKKCKSIVLSRVEVQDL